jgi:hypothetical protein
MAAHPQICYGLKVGAYANVLLHTGNVIAPRSIGTLLLFSNIWSRRLDMATVAGVKRFHHSSMDMLKFSCTHKFF